MNTKLRSYRFAAMSIAVVVAGALSAACSSEDDKVTLVLANSQWGDALRGEKLWAVMKKYEKVNPNVKLVKEEIPSADIATKLPTELGAGQGPDLMMIQEPLFWTVRDALLPLDEALFKASNLNETNDGGKVDGKSLGVAWQRAAYALIYNKKLLDDSGVTPPKTLDDLIEGAKKVSDKSGVIGFTARHQMSEFDNWDKDFQNWVYGYGGSWVKDGKLTIDTPENAAAVAAFKRLYDADVIPNGDDFPTQRNRFKAGDVAFSIDNSGGTLNIATGSDIKPSDVGAAPLPFPNAGSHQQIYLAVNKTSSEEEQQASLDFVKWFVGKEAQAAMRTASGPDILATDVPMDPSFAKKNPWAKTFYDLASKSSTGLIEGYETKTTQVMRPVMEAVERVLTENADPAEELAAAQAEVDGKVS